MSSGIVPTEAVIKTYELIQKNKLDWAVFGVVNEKMDVIEVFPEKDEDVKAFKEAKEEKKQYSNFKERVYEPLVSLIEEKYAKKAVFVCLDFRFSSDNGDRSKIALIKWCADSGVKVKDKMLLASSYDALVEKLSGLHAKPQYSSIGEWEYSNTKKEVPEK